MRFGFTAKFGAGQFGAGHFFSLDPSIICHIAFLNIFPLSILDRHISEYFDALFELAANASDALCNLIAISS